MNDITRPGLLFDRALADLDLLHERLARSGATVRDDHLPRYRPDRAHRQNPDHADAAHQRGHRHGRRRALWVQARRPVRARPSMTQPDTWSDDRVHGSTKGHMLFAAAAAEALNLPVAATMIGRRRAGGHGPTLRSRAYSQLLWTKNMLAPWLWHHARGISSGDGHAAETPRAGQPGRLEAEKAKRNRRLAAADRLHHPRAEERYGEPSEQVRSPERHARSSRRPSPRRRRRSGPDRTTSGRRTWPTATTLAGSVVLPRPALVTAPRNASVVGSA